MKLEDIQTQYEKIKGYGKVSAQEQYHLLNQLSGKTLILLKDYDFTKDKEMHMCCGNYKVHGKYRGCTRTFLKKNTMIFIEDVRIVELGFSLGQHQRVDFVIRIGCRKVIVYAYRFFKDYERGYWDIEK